MHINHFNFSPSMCYFNGFKRGNLWIEPGSNLTHLSIGVLVFYLSHIYSKIFILYRSSTGCAQVFMEVTEVMLIPLPLPLSSSYVKKESTRYQILPPLKFLHIHPFHLSIKAVHHIWVGNLFFLVWNFC